jgi:hypothetical protein
MGLTTGQGRAAPPPAVGGRYLRCRARILCRMPLRPRSWLGPLAALSLAVGAACRPVSLPAVVQGGATPKIPRPAPGRASIVGVVSDSTSGYPVFGASVYFTADSVVGVGAPRPRTDLPRATTDRSGGFALRDVAPGRYTIAIVDLDHFPVRRIVVVAADEVRTEIVRPARRARP